MLILMAFRNLWRNTRRTAITLFSIGFGLMLSLIFTGIGDSGYGRLIEGASRMGMGHVALIPHGYLDTPSIDKRIDIPSDLIDRLGAMRRVTAVRERITGQAMVATANDSAGAAFMAIDPNSETPDTLYFMDFLESGTLFDSKNRVGIVIGRNMADRLRVDIGGKLVYTLTDVHGEIISGLARVSGIFKTGVMQVDNYFVLLPINSLRELIGYSTRDVTHLAVFLDDHAASRSIQHRVQTWNGDIHGTEVVTWRDAMPDIAGLIAMDQSSNYLFQLIIFLLISAGILNTILMSVLERKREFGILLALGISPQRLFGLIMLEACWLCIFGVIAGLLLTAPVYGYLHSTGIDLTALFTEKPDVGGVLFDPTIHADLRPISLAVILTVAAALILLSGIYPAWKASRVTPVEAIQAV